MYLVGIFQSSQSHRQLLNVVRISDYIVSLMTECFMASQLERNPIRNHFSSEVPLGQAPRVRFFCESGIWILPQMGRQVWATPGPLILPPAVCHTTLMTCGQDISREHSPRVFILKTDVSYQKRKMGKNRLWKNIVLFCFQWHKPVFFFPFFFSLLGSFGCWCYILARQTKRRQCDRNWNNISKKAGREKI